MRGRGPYLIRISQSMKSRLIHIKQLLADQGYKIFPVSEPMRRSEEDFIAASTKPAMIIFFLVRPTRDDHIEFRMFKKTVYSDDLVISLKMSIRYHKSIRPVRFSRLLPAGNENYSLAQYVDPQYHNELRQYYPWIQVPQR